MIRFLVILALLWQPLTVFRTAASGAPGDGAHRCETSCCNVVERTTCCGERIFAEYCSKSGGACNCVSVPDREPQPRPEVPLSRVTIELVIMASVDRPALAWVSSDSARVSVLTTSWLTVSGRTHNEHQSFLGIWRT